jgi:Cu/Ag efflux protein CusF
MRKFKVEVLCEESNKKRNWIVSASTPEDAQQLAFALDGGWGKELNASTMLALAQSYCSVKGKTKPCECIKKVDANLAQDGLALRQHPTINLNSGEMGFDLAIETYAILRGAKKRLIRPIHCPFCGSKL